MMGLTTLQSSTCHLPVLPSEQDWNYPKPCYRAGTHDQKVWRSYLLSIIDDKFFSIWCLTLAEIMYWPCFLEESYGCQLPGALHDWLGTCWCGHLPSVSRIPPCVVFPINTPSNDASLLGWYTHSQHLMVPCSLDVWLLHVFYSNTALLLA